MRLRKTEIQVQTTTTMIAEIKATKYNIPETDSWLLRLHLHLHLEHLADTSVQSDLQ